MKPSNADTPLAHPLQLFLDDRARDPDAIAVEDGPVRLSRQDLLDLALALAARLGGAGAGAIGLWLPGSWEYLVGALAASLAGRPFVPLAPGTPPARLREDVERAQVAAMVTSARFAGPDGVPGVPLVRIDDVRAGGVDSRAAPAPASVLYRIFTSGTTGRPRCLEIEARSVTALVRAFDEVAGHDPQPRVSFLCPPSFDVSIFEVFSALVSGGTSVVVPVAAARDPAALADFLVARAITTAYVPPALLPGLARALQGRVVPLRRLLTGVEPIAGATLQALARQAPDLAIVNGYGPAETTVCATFHRFGGSDGSSPRVPIGCRLAGWTVELFGRDGEPVGGDEIGEIFIAGIGLARGYLADPTETARCFVERAGPDGRPVRWYRTGDLARRRPDGALEFVSRLDDQLKIRGYRVEPAEIEAELARIPGVEAGVAMPIDTAAGRRLVAFCAGPDAPRAVTVTSALAARLPRHLLPSRVVVVPDLPTTPHGKIDREALARIALRRPPEAGPLQPARSDLERTIVEVWAELLGLDELGVDDDLRAMGADSVMQIQASARLGERLSATLDLSALLAAATPRAIAQAWEAGAAQVPPAGPRASLPALWGQEQIWLWQRLQPRHRGFVLPVALRLSTAMPAARCAEILDGALAAQPALRLRLSWRTDRLEQEIAAAVAGRVSACGAADWTAAIDDAASEIASLAGPLYRGLARQGSEGVVHVVLLFHHLVFDGGSVGPLVEAIARAFDGAEPVPACDPTRVAPLQAAPLPADRHQALIRRWHAALADGVDALDVAALSDRASTPEDDATGSVELVIASSLSADLTELASATGASPFAVVSTALAAVLGRFCQQPGFVVGTAIASLRARAGMTSAIGCLVDLVPLRVEVAPDQTFARALTGQSAALADAAAMAGVSFQAVRAAGELAREAADKLTSVVIVHDLPPPPAVRARDAEIAVVRPPRAFTPYRLAFFVTAGGGAEWRIRCDYRTTAVSRETVESLLRSAARLLRGAAAAPEAPLGELRLLSPEEEGRLVALGCAPEPGAAFPLDRRFLEIASRWADRPAIVTGDAVIDYRTLLDRARRRAAALQSLGVDERRGVALHGGRRAELVEWALAAILAGSHYVPLDLASPPERLRLIFAAADPAVVVSTRPAAVDRAGVLDATFDPPDPGHAPLAARGPDSTAAIMFTSGSTGVPKGARIPDRAIARLVQPQRAYQLHERDVLMTIAQPAFDVALWEIWSALLNGAALAIASDDDVLDPDRLAARMIASGVTAAFFNVQLFERMLAAPPAALEPLHSLLVGGELVPMDLFRRATAVVEPGVLINGYGPTENTTYSTCYRWDGVTSRDADRVPVGVPMAGSAAWVVDDQLRPQPIGAVGEIAVAGDGLASEIISSGAEDASRRFRTHALPGRPACRLYMTGDRGRLRGDGLIDCLGRRDDQVKLRGHRVELGEIETALRRLAGVASATVIVDGQGAARRLVGFAVSERDGEGLRAELRATLPDYMIPCRVVRLDAFPLTGNGKIDRRALAELARRRAETAPSSGSATESQVAAIVGQLLGTDDVRPDDGFFDLGGNSILLVDLRGRLQARFSVALDVGDLYRAGSIAGIAALLAPGGEPAAAGPHPGALAARVEDRLARRRAGGAAREREPKQVLR